MKFDKIKIKIFIQKVNRFLRKKNSFIFDNFVENESTGSAQLVLMSKNQFEVSISYTLRLVCV